MLLQGVVQLGRALGVYSLHPSYRSVTSAFVKACRDHGIKVVSWTQHEAETPQLFQHQLVMGVDALTTDQPERLREFLAQYPTAER